MNTLLWCVSILMGGVMVGMDSDSLAAARSEILAWVKTPCQAERGFTEAEREQLTKLTHKLVRPGARDYSWIPQFIEDCNSECDLGKMWVVDRALVCHAVDAQGLRLLERQNFLMAILGASVLSSWRTDGDLRFPRCARKPIWQHIQDNVPVENNGDFKRFLAQYESKMRVEVALAHEFVDDYRKQILGK